MSRETPLESEEIQPEMCSVELRLEILGQVPFFQGLGAQAIEAINRRFRDRGYQPGEPIYMAGEEATHLYVVASGKVKLLRHTMAGQDVLLDILMPGEFFGALATLGESVYPDTAEAQTVCCVLAISAGEFQRILEEHPSAALRVLDLTAARLREAQETIRQLSAHTVRQRIATTLLKLAEKLGEEREEGLLIQMPLSRQDVADMTGATPETTSRVLSDFRKQGLIRSGRQWIAIVDWEGVEREAAE
ncbi:MAG: Crp/Fnr family transcriptional regulator [Chloroflexota bacterium]